MHDILMIHFCILIIAILICLMGQLVHIIAHSSELTIEFHLLNTDTFNNLTMQHHLALIFCQRQACLFGTVLHRHIVNRT